MHPRSCRVLFLVLGALLGGLDSLARAAVLVVDPSGLGPGVDFLSLSSAVTAAVDGDTILVRNSPNQTLDVNGKALTIVGEPTAFHPQPVLQNGVHRIRNLPAGKSVVLRGFQVNGLEIIANQGLVWLEDCSVFTVETFASLRVHGSARVVVIRCQLWGHIGGWDFSQDAHLSPGAGLEARDSNLHVAECIVQGGEGKFTSRGPFGAGYYAAQDGAAAAILRGSTQLIAVDTSFAGGNGGLGKVIAPVNCGLPGDGAPGIWLASGSPSATLSDIAATGGSGGASAPCFDPLTGTWFTPPNGTNAASIQIDAGFAIALPEPARGLEANAPVREGQNVVLSFAGEPGDSALLLVAASPGSTPMTQYGGSLLLDLPIGVLVPVPLPPNGALQAAVPLPELGPGVESARVLVQAAFCPASGACVLSSGSAVVLLDAGI